MQSLRRQVIRRALRSDHLRGLQGILSKIAELRGQLPVSAQQAMCGGPC